MGCNTVLKVIFSVVHLYFGVRSAKKAGRKVNNQSLERQQDAWLPCRTEQENHTHRCCSATIGGTALRRSCGTRPGRRFQETMHCCPFLLTVLPTLLFIVKGYSTVTLPLPPILFLKSSTNLLPSVKKQTYNQYSVYNTKSLAYLE